MKYICEVGGFVTVFRHRKLEVYADSYEEAENKAIDQFIKIQTSSGGDCDDATVDLIMEDI